jgi:D-alanine-D-alanine ligase
MAKLRVAVLFGGRSGEHEVSLRSALAVMSAMDPARYEVLPICIGRNGQWFLRDDALDALAVAAQHLAELDTGGVPAALLPYPLAQGALCKANGADRSRILKLVAGEHVDVVFPILHGTYGEDGTVQGLFELADVPYVGSGVLGSALGMSKDAQKRLMREAGIPVTKFAVLTKWDFEADRSQALHAASKLGYPVYVKPSCLGSSIGVSRVCGAQELEPAILDALRYDRKVLIEAACEGRELECAVLGNRRPEVAGPGEIVVERGHAFYSYESKYVDPKGAKLMIPAPLPAATAQRIRAMAQAAFIALDLRGMARVDFLAREDLSEIVVNEVNTIPGFTEISMYPKLWAAAGMPMPKLVDRLIELALEEHAERRALSFTYRARASA